MKNISVYLEKENDKISNCSFELVSKADELKSDALDKKNENYSIEAIVIAKNLSDDDIQKVYSAGADKLVHIKTDNEDFIEANYPNYFIDYYKNNLSDIILFPATQKGRDFAPKVCAYFNCGLVADCIELEFVLKNDVLLLAPTRPTFGSELMAMIISKKFPQCATIRPNIFKANFKYDKKGEFVEYIPKIEKNETIKLLTSFLQKDETDFDYKNAKVILSAGYGLYKGDNSYYIKLKKLAEKFNVHYGATRKVVDYNLENKKYQIGQTGASVAPQLYVAFGISGALQHISGIKNSKKIVAINTDENAEIFKYADYKIVADARKIIDELIQV